MKQVLISVMCLFVIFLSPAQVKSIQKPAINTLEDFFRFENVDQLTSHFGAENVFTEVTYFGEPNKGAKPYLTSQVDFGTPHAVLVVWNHKGTQVVEVKSSAYYYDSQKGKIAMIPNEWKTVQGIHAGMNLSQLVKVNWFALTFLVQPGNLNNGTILHGFGWLREKRSVPYSKEKLVYNYTLDVKRIKNHFPGLTSSTLKSNDKTVRKWNPMLELVSIYREGMKPE